MIRNILCAFLLGAGMSASLTSCKTMSATPSAAVSAVVEDNGFGADTPEVEQAPRYTNPVLAKSLPDPTVIKDDDGFFYLFATENTHNVPILRSRDLVGTGHNSEIVTDANGNDWMLYHAFLASDPDRGRVLMVDRLRWNDGWPEVEAQVPSSSADGPIFR